MAQAKKKKKFFDVEVPLIEKPVQLYAYTLDELQGRIIKYDLTRILRGKATILRAEVKIKEDRAIAIPLSIQILPSFLKRVVRKGTNYIEDSFSAACKDANIVIKPFLVTRRKVPRIIRTALRNKARELLIDYIKDKQSDVLFDEIIKTQLQKSLNLKLKKIYPLSFCDIRIFRIEKSLALMKEEK